MVMKIFIYLLFANSVFIIMVVIIIIIIISISFINPLYLYLCHINVLQMNFCL